MRNCFVPFCDVKNKDQPNRTMFLAPKERKLFAQWSDVLPKVRQFKSTDKVCYLHFKPDEILSTFDHLINGHLIKIQRDRRRLKPNAVPSLDITTKEEWLSRRAKCRVSNQTKQVEISENTEKNFELNLNIEEDSVQENNYVEVRIGDAPDEEEEEEIELNNVTNYEDHEASTTTRKFECRTEDVLGTDSDSDHQKPLATNNITSKEAALMESLNLFNFFYDNVYEVLIPNTLWGIHRCPQRSFLCFSCVDAFKMQTTKMLVVKSDGSIQLIIEGNVKNLNLVHDIDDLDSLSILLNKMDVGRLCFGRATNVNCDFIVEPNDDNFWFTDDNEEAFLCKFCLSEN